MIEVKSRTPELIEALLKVWEESVRATHKFLSEPEIEKIKAYGVTSLTVNEQNPQARGFYEHMGFEVYKRIEADEQGGPYPLLYMSLTDRSMENTANGGK